jgi:hypothetical protein
MINTYNIEVNGQLIIIDGEVADNLFTNISRKAQYSPIDVKDNKTYALNIPYSSQNAAVFGFGVEDLYSSSSTDSVIKREYSANIYIDGNLIFQGIMTINGIVQYPSGKKSYYRCFFRPSKLDWFNTLNKNPLYGDLKPRPYYLCDIFPNISVSYGTYMAGYLSGIDTTTGKIVNTNAATSIAEAVSLIKTPDILFPTISYGGWQNGNGDIVCVGDLRPAIRWIDIFVYAANISGYTIDPNSFSYIDTLLQGRFFDLICPFFGNRFKRSLAYMMNPTNYFSKVPTMFFNNVYTNVFPSSTWCYTVPDSGDYKFNLRLQGDGYLLSTSSSSSKSANIAYYIVSSTRGILSSSNTSCVFTKTTPTGFDFTINFEIFLNEGEQIAFACQTSDSECYTQTSSIPVALFAITPSGNIYEGNSFNTSDVFDNTIPISEMIQDFMTMFNIYCSVDVIKKVLYFETRDGFFNALSSAKDMSDKIDMLEETEQDFYMDSYGQAIEYKFASGGLGYDKYYQDKQISSGVFNAQEFGYTVVGTNSGFQQNNTTIELKHMITAPMLYDKKINAPGIHPLPLIPCYWKSIEGFDLKRPSFTEPSNPSVLVFTNPSVENNNFGVWNFLYNSYSILYTIYNVTAYSIHPFLNINLLFKSFKYYHYDASNSVAPPYFMDTGSAYDMPGLLDLFHYNTLRDIRNGYLLHCFMVLNSLDLVRDDGKTIWFLKQFGKYFIWEEIEELDAEGKRPSKVQLKTITAQNTNYLPLPSSTEITPNYNLFPFLT